VLDAPTSSQVAAKPWKTPASMEPKWSLDGEFPKLTLSNTEIEGTVYLKTNYSESFERGLEYQITLHGLPAGATATIGETSAKPVEHELWRGVELVVPLGPVIRELPVDEAFAEDVPVVPRDKLVLAFPDGGTAEVALQPTKWGGARAKIDRVKDGNPFPFGPDEPPSKPTDAIYYDRFAKPLADKIIGHPKTLGDIARVAVSTTSDKRDAGKKCSGYDSGKTYDLKLSDLIVRVYDRRTGKLAAEKTFQAQKRCPMFVSTADAVSSPDDKVAIPWLRTVR